MKKDIFYRVVYKIDGGTDKTKSTFDTYGKALEKARELETDNIVIVGIEKIETTATLLHIDYYADTFF